MADDNLSTFEGWAGAQLAKLAPAAQRKLAIEVGRELRASQKQRIAAQKAPDGAAYEARKPREKLRKKAGRIKNRSMFLKLRTVRYLKVEQESTGVAIGFVGRAARLARVHQFGETSQVAPGGKAYKYPVRQLLGFTQRERDMIRDKLLEHLTK